jgi:hypothetical protein
LRFREISNAYQGCKKNGLFHGVSSDQHLSMVRMVCVAGLNLNRAPMIALQLFDHFWMPLDVVRLYRLNSW